MGRARVRALSQAAAATDDPLAWFEQLYAEAARGEAVVPWDDRAANPGLVSWLAQNPAAPGARALDVGCGLGDNALALAAAGYAVTAFDLAPTAIAAARARHPDAPVAWTTGDLLSPDPAWAGAFDLVSEIYTLQAMPPALVLVAAARLRSLLAPGGRLLVLARGREADEVVDGPPWPLSRAELEAIGDEGVGLASFEDYLDGEDPPTRRFRAVFQRV